MIHIRKIGTGLVDPPPGRQFPRHSSLVDTLHLHFVFSITNNLYKNVRLIFNNTLYI